jgi:DNA (cytosine-5)-methyltransferase 1
MNPNDERSLLIWSFADAIKLIKPTCFVMENVKALGTLKRWQPVISNLINTFNDLGYYTELRILNSSDFGVSQSRERMFLFGFSKSSFSGNKPEIDSILSNQTSKAKTIRDLFNEIGKVGSPNNPETCKAKITFAAKPILRKSPYAGMLFNGQGRPLNPDGYSSTLPASMGGNRTPIIDNEQVYNGNESWVENYHRFLLNGGLPDFNKTVPERLRRLTITEASRIQDFPIGYKFAGSQSSIYTQIGNAVPSGLGHAVAQVLKHNILKLN